MNIFDLVRSRSQWGSELGRILPVIITSNEVWKRKKYKIFVNSSFEGENKFSQKSDENIFMNNFWVRVEKQFFERLSLVRSSLKSLYRPRFHNSSERLELNKEKFIFWRMLYTLKLTIIFTPQHLHNVQQIWNIFFFYCLFTTFT